LRKQVEVAPLAQQDRARWDVLARGYKAFYETPLPDPAYDEAWRRLMAKDKVLGLGAKVDGKLLGIAHYYFHTSMWAPEVCYLQDLFTDAEARGHGVGRALIEAIAAEAKARKCDRYYWLTHETNATARKLYDKVAKWKGFIRYDYPL
jgi:GNAT superfamily N-acetyltransferase